jgi:hypothetical protein
MYAKWEILICGKRSCTIEAAQPTKCRARKCAGMAAMSPKMVPSGVYLFVEFLRINRRERSGEGGSGEAVKLKHALFLCLLFSREEFKLHSNLPKQYHNKI